METLSKDDDVPPPPTLLERRRLHTRVTLAAHPHSRSPSHLHLPSTPSPSTVAFPTSPTSTQLTSTNPNGFRHPAPTLRHNRVHSRNLSLFFPRPESLPHTTIQEDEVEGQQQAKESNLVPELAIPSAGSSVDVTAGKLSTSFRFGSRPPNAAPLSPSVQGPSRRGHHHKHSLSHNFFSFLEPGAQTVDSAHLHTEPTPVPVSPWAPISPFPKSAAPEKSSFSPVEQRQITHALSNRHSRCPKSTTPPTISYVSLACAVGQCLLGAWLWVVGQHVSSLACTGLGYWVVFDAIGIVVAFILPQWLQMIRERDSKILSRQFYGTARVGTVCMFAQAVYLMFASVYMSKEAVEHFLLHTGNRSTHAHAGGGSHVSAEGHHHHLTEPELVGSEVPYYLISLALLSTMGNALVFKNHSDLANVASNRFQSLTSLLRSFVMPSRSNLHFSDVGGPENFLVDILSNPFIVAPMSFGLAIISIATFIEPGYHRILDLMLACLQAVVTFRLAYRACIILGTVLLQTSPPRGFGDGRMEAFLRAMKEIERHPKVLHLPAPHIWQVTPANRHPSSHGYSAQKRDPPGLVVTLELHVHADLEDHEVMKLTRWTWEKCVTALGAPAKAEGSIQEVAGIDVSVGIVRG